MKAYHSLQKRLASGCDSHSSDKFYHWGGLLGLIALMEAAFME